MSTQPSTEGRPATKGGRRQMLSPLPQQAGHQRGVLRSPIARLLALFAPLRVPLLLHRFLACPLLVVCLHIADHRTPQQSVFTRTSIWMDSLQSSRHRKGQCRSLCVLMSLFLAKLHLVVQRSRWYVFQGGLAYTVVSCSDVRTCLSRLWC